MFDRGARLFEAGLQILDIRHAVPALHVTRRLENSHDVEEGTGPQLVADQVMLGSGPDLYIVRQQLGRHVIHRQHGPVGDVSWRSGSPVPDDRSAYGRPQAIRSNERRASHACSMLRFQRDAAFILTEGANLAPQVQRNPVALFVGSVQKYLLNVRTIADPIGITEPFEEGASQLLATDIGPGRTVQQDQRVGFKGKPLDRALQAQLLKSS